MTSHNLIYLITLFLISNFDLIAGHSLLASMPVIENASAPVNTSTDTVSPRYLPLATGNVYKYHFGSSGGASYNYKVRILRDTIIDSKKYFVADGYFPGSIDNVIRCDSTTGNIYTRANFGYCTYSPFEVFIDSMRSGRGDTAFACWGLQRHVCTDTGFANLFGNQVKSKSFIRQGTEDYTVVTYGIDFGIIFVSYHDFWGIASESLSGCYVNGVLYGDTTLTDISNSDLENPDSQLLLQNYPNPFNPVTTISYKVRKTGHVLIRVYDFLGKETSTLVNGRRNSGLHTVEFNSRLNGAASDLPSGLYFCVMSVDGKRAGVMRMVMVK